MKKNIFYFVCMLAFLISGTCMTSCKDDESFPSQTTLEQTIAEAQSLLDTTEEGIEEGDYAPGSKKQLQTRVDWAKFIIDTAENDVALTNANKILTAEIEAYRLNTVKPGYPSFSMASNMDLGKVADYDILEKFTIEYAVRFKDMTGNNVFTAEDNTGGFINRYAGNTLQAYVHNGGWVGGNVSFSFQPQTWYAISFVFDGQTVKYYVNGVQRMTSTGAAKKMNVKPETRIKIGTHPTYAGRYFVGEVYHVSIWNKAKTQAEVIADITKDFTGTEAGLLAYWPFNLNIGSEIMDKTGNHQAVATQVLWVSP